MRATWQALATAMLVVTLTTLAFAGFLFFSFLAQAAETEEAPAASFEPVALEQLRTAIEAEQDLELRHVMEEQYQLLESGQLDLTHELDTARGTPGTVDNNAQVSQLPEMLAGPGLVGPPIDIGTGGGTPLPSGESLPPEVRGELEKLFQEKGTGDPSQDQAVREEAEKILEQYGIERPESWGQDHEHQQWEHEAGPGPLEHVSPEALEHMAPEAREQLERFFEAPEHEFTDRPEAGREVETFSREYEAPSHEQEAPEALVHEYEAPTHEFEAPTQEYQGPEHEAPVAPECPPETTPSS